MIKIEGRSLKIPTQERTIGWVGDNRVEVRIFELIRHYGDIDLAGFDFKLDTQSGDVKNIIDLDKTVADDKITLTWTVKESHILNPGHMSIQIRAFKDSEEKWHSAQGYVKVQPSINAEQSIPDPLPSEFVQMEQRVTQAKNEAIEAAQEAMQQAERVEDIIQEAEQDVLPELRQAIEDGIETKNQLGGSIQEAGEAKTALDGSISSAGTAKGELDGSINEANTAKGQLDDSIDLAGNAKTELDGSITAAGQAKELLDESIATGDLATFKGEFQSHLDDYATYKDSNNLKVAKVEKELNDYKATMQQVNINQEPKQKATGYGVISLPPNAAEGQVSGVVRGETLTNLANNGDSYENWQVTYAVEIVNNIITIPHSPGDYQARLPVNLKPNTSYTIFYNIVDKVGDIILKIWNNLTGNYIANISEALGQNRILIKTQSTITDNRLIFYAGGSTGDTISVTDIMVFEGDYTDREIPYITGTKSTISAMRLKSVSADETETSTAYVVAKDEEGKIAELRSLPNGTKDEVRVSGNKAEKVQRIGTKILNGSENWTSQVTSNTKVVSVYIPVAQIGNNVSGIRGSLWCPPFTVGNVGITNVDSINMINFNQTGSNLIIDIDKTWLVTPDALGFKAWLQANPLTLNYQLAEPVEIPVQVSGSIVSYPNGTIYIERILPDAGVYTDKITILHQDAPIKRLDRLSKVDFYTGVETELDVSEAVIAEDKLSFTHPDLSEGDIVFFEYEYDLESTQGETEIEYYDSRYVIKDSVTDKFYKWNIVVANGQPSIELVEV